MSNPTPILNNINAFDATKGTTISFNIIGGTEIVRSNIVYIYDLSTNDLICTHLYISTESIHELPPNTDPSIVYASGKSSADFVNNKNYYLQIQTFTNTAGTAGGSGMSVAKTFWCLFNPALSVNAIPAAISTTSYNVGATYTTNITDVTIPVTNIIQQYKFDLYTATGTLVQTSGNIIGSGEQEGTSTTYNITYNFSGLVVNNSYYVIVTTTSTEGMTVSAQSSTFTVSIDTPTLGEATVVNNACDGYISVTSNLSSEYGGSGSGDIVSFETDSENVFTKLQVAIEPTQSGSGTASPDNVRPIYGVGGVDVDVVGKNLWGGEKLANDIKTAVPFSVLDTSNKTIAVDRAQSNAVPLTTIKFKENTRYTFVIKFSNTVARTNLAVVYTDGTINFIPTRNTGLQTVVYTTDNGKTVDYLRGYNSDGTTVIYYEESGLFQGVVTADDFEPYNPNSTTVSQEFDVSLTSTSKDTDPYLFKAVGDIYGDRLEEDIVGGTVAWNQLVQNGNFADTSGWTSDNATLTANGNVLTYTSTTASGSAAVIGNVLNTTAGHKYFVSVDIKCNNTLPASGVWVGSGGHDGVTKAITELNKWVSVSGVFIRATGGNDKISVYPRTTLWNEGDTCDMRNIVCFDLTQMFNPTIADYIYSLEQSQAGAGVAWFRQYFPKDYYPYDPGTLRSVEGVSAHEMVGRNLLEPKLYSGGGYNSSIGTKWNLSASENQFERLSDGSYSITFPSSWTQRVMLAKIPPDASSVYVSLKRTSSGTAGISIGLLDEEYTVLSAYNNTDASQTYGGAFTVPGGAKYLYIVITNRGGSNVTITITEPQVEIGTTATGYEPYTKHTYPLDSSLTLRGVPKLVDGKLAFDGDVYPPSGEVQRRYGLRGYQSGDESLADAITDGTNTVYKLATPTTETADGYEHYQICDPSGTEQFVTTGIVPVGHETTYLTRDIFGGTLDLVTGVLTVDRAMVTLDGVTDGRKFTGSFGATSNGYSVYWNDDIPRDSNAISDRFVASRSGVDNMPLGSFVGGSGVIGTWTFILPSSITSKDEANAWLTENPTTIVYELTTPQTYQLTPHQIQTLVGQNNVWSDAGDVEVTFNLPISNLLVKRQDASDVSGDWLTLYSQPITQASDMDFTFIDFLNQNGKTYRYALVPLLTQQQGDIDVEIEGGYTVSDDVLSVFDGVFIANSNGSQKLKAATEYGDLETNQDVGVLTTIGGKYPFVVSNSNLNYHSGSVSALIVPSDFYTDGDLNRLDTVERREAIEQFLTDKTAKILKDWNGNIWLITFIENVEVSFVDDYGMGLGVLSAKWVEIGDVNDQTDLQQTGLI